MSERNQKIEAMYRSDVRGAWTFVATLWIVVLFALFVIWPVIPAGGVRIAALLAAGVVLVFNTASIATLVRSYVADKDFVHGLDIRLLDDPH